MVQQITKDIDEGCRYWARQTKKMNRPFKDLTNNEEYKGDGQRHPQVTSFGVHPSIPILQVGPAQALWKPQPLLPEPLTQPRHHPETQNTQDLRVNSTQLKVYLAVKQKSKDPWSTCSWGRIYILKRNYSDDLQPACKSTCRLYGPAWKAGSYRGLAMYIGRHLWLGCLVPCN